MNYVVLGSIIFAGCVSLRVVYSPVCYSSYAGVPGRPLGKMTRRVISPEMSLDGPPGQNSYILDARTYTPDIVILVLFTFGPYPRCEATTTKRKNIVVLNYKFNSCLES